ncbi:MAG: DUF924 family protein [Psychrobium sp.]
MQEVLNFWFSEIEQSQWWTKDSDFDNEIIEQFSKVHQAAVACELYDWRKTPEGRLAEIIVLDQFSRNMFRDTPQSFAYDSLALALAQEAINVGADKALDETQRSFLYMPFMHSESLAIHERAVELFSQPNMEHNLDFEIRHKEIIERFGRYPHRNEILGRESSSEEIEFLTQPGSSF